MESSNETTVSMQESYETLLPQFENINPCLSPDIPMDIYLQEAKDLHFQAQQDANDLTQRGLNPQYTETLQARICACQYAQGLWFKEYRAMQEAHEIWKKEAPEAFEMRDLLLDELDFAFYNRPDLLNQLSDIKEGNSNSDMILDLSNIVILAKDHTELLQATAFEMANLDKAMNMSERLGALNAAFQRERNESHPAKIMRDKAYTYLKEAVDEIRRVGRFVFRHQADILEAYQRSYKNTHK